MNQKPGWQTTEFWLVILRFAAGVALTIIESTREIGIMMLGLGGNDGISYTRSRTELKKG